MLIFGLPKRIHVAQDKDRSTMAEVCSKVSKITKILLRISKSFFINGDKKNLIGFLLISGEL